MEQTLEGGAERRLMLDVLAGIAPKLLAIAADERVGGRDLGLARHGQEHIV